MTVKGRIRADDTTAIYAAVTRGLGLGFSPLWPIKDLVESGAVEIVLEEFESRPVPIHAVWPVRKSVPAKTTLFVEILARRLKTQCP